MTQDIRSDDELWNEFHRVVNMSSAELEEWLLTRAAGSAAEELPEHAGAPMGQQVLHVLRKRRTDLQDNDLQVMRKVVSRVYHERGEGTEVSEPVSGEAAEDPEWRHRLMSVGHDPLKSVPEP